MQTRWVPQVLVSHLGLLTLGVATSIYPVSLKVKMVRRGRLDVLNRCYAPLYPASSHGGYTMKLLATFGVLLFVSVPAHAQAQAQAQAAAPAQTAKPCEELKDEITKKLDAKGVKGYTLDIVAKDKDADGKTVGTCDGDTKKIIYNRTTAPTATPAKEPPKS